MIKPILLFLLIVFSLSIKAQPQIKITKPKQKFGMVKQGAIVSLYYEFTNTGNRPLTIYKIEAECSCTQAKWPDKPTLPGQKDTITIIFNTEHAFGRQDRIAEVESSVVGDVPDKIRFKGVVLRK